MQDDYFYESNTSCAGWILEKKIWVDSIQECKSYFVVWMTVWWRNALNIESILFYNHALTWVNREKLPHFYKDVLIYYTRLGDSKLNNRNLLWDLWNIAEIQHLACLKKQTEKFSVSPFHGWHLCENLNIHFILTSNF